MRKSMTILLILAGLILSSNAQDNQSAVSIPAIQNATALPTFTDSSSYNSYDIGGSPIGLLDRLTTPIILDLRYRTLSLHKKSSPDSLKKSLTEATVPFLAIGVPQMIFLTGFYQPLTYTIDSTTFSLKRFGANLIGGAPSRILSFSLSAAGYMGNLDRTGMPLHRTVLGFRDISLHVGSQVHELVRLGFGVSGSGAYDSISGTLPNGGGTPDDRYFTGIIPVFGGEIDVDGKNLPVRANGAISWGTGRFLYSTLQKSNQPIFHDSLSWKGQAMGSFSFSNIGVSPAMSVGFWRSNGQIYDTIEGNNNPLQAGNALSGQSWRTSSFHLGFGTAVSYMSWARATIEYTWSDCAMKAGSHWSTFPEIKQNLHRTSIGISSNLDAIPLLHFPDWLQASLGMGYLNLLDNSAVNAYRTEDLAFAADPLAINSQSWRYAPPFGAGGYERISRFSIGAGVGVWQRMISLDTYLAWLTRTTAITEKGFEFGLDVTYQMKNIGR